MFSLLLTIPPATAATSPSSKQPDWFGAYNWSGFQKLDEARQPLHWRHFNTNLLDAAVFHETNRRRSQHGLPALAYHPRARQAAAMQAGIMAERGSISHVNPEHPELRTLMDRVRKAGLNPRFAAENVATAFALQYESGQPFYVREQDGEKIFSREPNGEPIPTHTYLTFARALLDAWMNSPEHRKNILHQSPKHLGTSCRPGENQESIPIFYCDQVFFTRFEE